MPIYHFHAKIISRSSGRSAVAAAAYRSGDTLTNEYDGVSHDYSGKYNILYSEIMLPENAPDSFSDRSVLWNAVETVEKSSRAQLAREIEIALPQGLTLDQAIALAREYCYDNFVVKGMCVDFSIHNPPVTNKAGYPIDINGQPTNNIDEMIFRNPHVHIMLTMRSIDDYGKWEAKTSQEYVCVKFTDNGREERNMTSEEFKRYESDGWYKQYQYYDGNTKVWLTRSEAANKGLEQVNKFPKRETIDNPKSETWNSKEQLLSWRENWARTVNQTLEALGRAERIDHRSYEEQGIDRIPTVHLGHTVVQLEKCGIATDLGNINREIQANNSILEQLKESLKNMVDSAIKVANTIIDKVANKLEYIRALYIGNDYRISLLESQKNLLEGSMYTDNYNNRITTAYDQLRESNSFITELKSKIKDIRSELLSLSPFQIIQKKDLEVQCDSLQLKIEHAIDYKETVYQSCGVYDDSQVMNEYKAFKANERIYNIVTERIDNLSKEQADYKNEFEASLKSIDVNDQSILESKRSECRDHYESAVIKQLRSESNKEFDIHQFEKSTQKANMVLSGNKASEMVSYDYDKLKNIRHDIKDSKDISPHVHH